MDFQTIKNQASNTPAFILNADAMINNLQILNTLSQQCGCKILYSIKALPLLSTALEIAIPLLMTFLSAYSLYNPMI